MKNYYFLVLLLLSAFCVNASAQITVDKSMIKAFTPTQSYTPAKVAPTYAPQSDEVVAKAYGIRCYDATQGAVQQFVSFDVNNPGSIKLEKDLSEYFIRAAAYANGYYYMINSLDGLCAYHLLAMNLETFEIDTIATYEINDYEAAIIFSDMTYDSSTSTMYGLGYDLETAIIDEENENSMEVELALVTIDLNNGDMTCVGHQNFCNIVTLAADNYGYLWGIDGNGDLWDINKANGKPGEAMGYSSVLPTSLQSMSFHPENNTLYWCGFSATETTSSGFFSKFDFTDDAINYENIGTLSDNAEILGLHIDANPAASNTPDAVSEISITPGAEGANMATISFVTPTKLLNEESITGTIDVLIYRDDALLVQLDNKNPGATIEYVDNTPTTGFHTYTIACSNENGEGKSITIKNIYIGRDLPGEVANLKAAKTNGKSEVVISWEAPTSGMNGGWYDATALTYTATRYPDGVIIAENINATTLTDSDITTLNGYTYHIGVTNTDGTGATTISNRIVAGPSIDVPYTCNFGKQEAINVWTVIDGDQDGHEWFPASYASTGQTFMKFAPDTKYHPETPANDWLITPPLKLKAGVTYTMEYDMLLLGPLFPVDYNVTIGKEATIEAQSTIIESIDSLVINMAFTPQYAIFNVEEDGEYYLGYQIRNAVMVQITDVVVRELDAIDLAVEMVKANKIANINTEMAFNVTIKNKGANDVEGYIVKIVNENGDVIASAPEAELLLSQESCEHTIYWTPQEESDMTLYAVVEKEGDAIAENNKSEAFTVQVLEEGEWAHIQPNNAIMNYVPFTPSFKYSQAETVYFDNEINFGKCVIKGLVYYTYVFNNAEVKNFNAKISLANTDENEPDPNVLSTVYTQVYSGTIRPTSETTSIYIPFDQPFEYDGGNLSVRTQHSAQYEDANLMFYGSRDEDSGYWRSWYFTNSKYEFDINNVQLNYEIPNVSFFMTETNAVGKIENSNAPRAYMSHGNLFVAGEYDTLHIYSVDGRLCATHNANEMYIPMNDYPAGIYIVKVISDGAQSTTKIAVGQ